MSSHCLYVSCPNCSTTNILSTDTIELDDFDDNAWEGEFIKVLCRNCQAAPRPANAGVKKYRALEVVEAYFYNGEFPMSWLGEGNGLRPSPASHLGNDEGIIISFAKTQVFIPRDTWIIKMPDGSFDRCYDFEEKYELAPDNS